MHLSGPIWHLGPYTLVNVCNPDGKIIFGTATSSESHQPWPKYLGFLFNQGIIYLFIFIICFCIQLWDDAMLFIVRMSLEKLRHDGNSDCNSGNSDFRISGNSVFCKFRNSGIFQTNCNCQLCTNASLWIFVVVVSSMIFNFWFIWMIIAPNVYNCIFAYLKLLAMMHHHAGIGL